MVAAGMAPTAPRTAAAQARPTFAPEAVTLSQLPHGPGAPILKIGHARRDAEIAHRLAVVAAAFETPVFAGPHPSGASSRDTVRLLLAWDEETFRQASGGRFPDWGLAVAFPSAATIVLRTPRLVSGAAQDPGQVLVHELVHVYLGLVLGPALEATPRWFQEGTASLLAGEWGWSNRFELVLALLARRPIGLERLERGFPRSPDLAALAYLESLTAVAYLRDISGEEGMRVFLANLRRIGDFDLALRRTYGITYGEFQERWRASLAGRYGWAGAAASSWTYWTPAALLLIVLVIVRRARYRARLAELEREERLAGQAGTGVPLDGEQDERREADIEGGEERMDGAERAIGQEGKDGEEGKDDEARTDGERRTNGVDPDEWRC